MLPGTLQKFLQSVFSTNKPTPFDAFFARLYTKCEIDQTGMFRIQWYSGYDKEQYVFVISQRVKLKLIPLAHVAG